MKHTLAYLDDANANAKLEYRPVHKKPLTNEIAPVPPQKRVY
jgi:hypothetical protein